MQKDTDVNGTNVPEILLTEIDGEPRARDLDIAERLGFERPRKIRDLIKANLPEIETFGVCPAAGQTSGPKGGRPGTEFWLNEEQSLLVATLSDAPKAAAVRALLIKTFVAWRRGHLAAPAFDGTVTDLAPAVRAALGGIVKGIVHKEMAEAVTEVCTTVCAAMMPGLLKATLANQTMIVRRGRTAGQILREGGFPPMKGLASWFGNRLTSLGYTVDGEGRADHGDRAVRIFDPDRVRVWLRNGGRLMVEKKIAERRGQKVIHLVQPLSEGARTY